MKAPFQPGLLTFAVIQWGPTGYMLSGKSPKTERVNYSALANLKWNSCVRDAIVKCSGFLMKRQLTPTLTFVVNRLQLSLCFLPEGIFIFPA